MYLYRTIIYLTLFVPSLVWAQTPTPAHTPGYFESHYNPVPNTGGPNQLKMLGTWGNFTSVDGYSNNYLPEEGDETGAFWNNGTDDILVGVTRISQDMADDRVYGRLDVFGDDPDVSGELSEGLINGATIFFRIYGPAIGGEYAADPTLSFNNGSMWTEHTLAADIPPTPTPPPTASPTVSPSPSVIPTPSVIPSASPTPSATAQPTISPSPTVEPSIPPAPTSSPTASPSPSAPPVPTMTLSPSVTPVPTSFSSPTPIATPSSPPTPSVTPTSIFTATPASSSTPTPRPTVFPDPDSTTQWDLLYGDIAGSWTSAIGDEVVAYDSGGTLRLHYVVTTPGYYGSGPFYGPPTGSGGGDTSTFTWRFYSAVEDRIYDLRSNLGEWPVYQGTMGSHRVDLNELSSTPTPTPTIIETPSPTCTGSPSPSITPTPTPTVIPTPASVRIYSFPLNSDPGWSIEGDWAFGVPTGQGGAEPTPSESEGRGKPDPTSGHTGSNVYGYNLNGNYSNNMDAYYLTTGEINCSHLVKTRLKFWRWLNVERRSNDEATIQISNDGSTWNTIWTNSDSIWIIDADWSQYEYDISSFADGEAKVYIRWIMGLTNQWNIYSGWNIDDIEIWGVPTAPTPVPIVSPSPTPHSPVPIIDFNGDGTSDIAIFRGNVGLWAIRGVTRVYYGTSTDLPVPEDYDGDGTSDIAVFREISGLWAIRGISRSYFGGIGDIPQSGDYNGDGTAEVGIFRESYGLWAVRGVTRVYFGGTGDIPVSGYYGGGSARNIGIFRGSSGLWAIRSLTRVYFGSSVDEPVSGDYNGDGGWSVGIFRPGSGLWAIRGITRCYFGGFDDYPVSANYSGSGVTDIGVFRSSTGLWAIKGMTRVYYGSSSDLPVNR